MISLFCIPFSTGQRYKRVYLLYEPDVDQKIDLDIVLIHGLHGSCDRTWREAKKNILWPRDWLPKDLSSREIKVRVLSVAYNYEIVPTPVGGSGKDESRKKEEPVNMVEFDFESPASEVLQSLLDAHVGKRPVVFLTHGAGGLILKKVLLTTRSQHNADPK